MASFFKTLDRMHKESGADEIPTFLSTHPHPADRFNKVGRLADSWSQQYPNSNSVNRNSYLRKIDGLVYGEDPRQGFVENSVFYHPELKFQFPVPQSWKTVNMPTQVQMAPENGKSTSPIHIVQRANFGSSS